MLTQKTQNLLKTLGPGILFASTAIGVSHLVQSTRAGADYGFELLIFIFAANLFKYPFFEYASRYANATGTSIIDGYEKLGRWMSWTYFLLTIGSMFFVTSAVAFVTAGFMKNLFNVGGLEIYVYLVFGVCGAILYVGKFNVLDSLIKVIASVLLLSTIMAFVLTLIQGPIAKVDGFVPLDIFSNASILFIIALMGWMPTALDLSTWNSLWTIERIKETGYKPTLKETLLDFNFGYITSAVLAVCFVTLGAYLMHGSGNAVPEGAGAFANFVVNLYTSAIGDWSYIIIAASAFSIMFGTAIAVFDGYSRAIERSAEILFVKPNKIGVVKSNSHYKIALILLLAGSFSIVYYYIDNPSGIMILVDLATTISFLIAPLIAVVNFILVNKKYVGQDAVPPIWMKVLSYVGVLFLTGFSLFFVYIKFMQ